MTDDPKVLFQHPPFLFQTLQYLSIGFFTFKLEQG